MPTSFFQTHRGGSDDPRASARSVVLARHAAVCTSHPLASEAGLAALRSGGNAVDAALTAAAVLGVVEPYNTGIGGDCFALVWSAREGRLFALNGSGRAPAAASAEELRAAGCAEMPVQGAQTVTVPGAIAAWAALAERFGTRSLGEVLGPAIEIADEGFAVSEIVAWEWALVVAFGFLRNDDARRCFAAKGEGPRVGEIVRLPDLARSLRSIGDQGPDVFYEGELADRMLATLAAEGSRMSRADFARTRADWVDPIGLDYRGHRLCAFPPNTQGISALIALGLLQHFELAAYEPGSPEAIHAMIEAVKLAFADRDAHVADPDHMRVRIESLLDPERLRRLAARIDPARAAPDGAAPPAGSDTVYLTTADRDGNVVSFINSLYGPFGSGLVAGDTGITLQNRGRGFSLEAGHPNELAGGKRPFHTLCPAMLLEGGRPRVSFGVMGGNVQAQAHVQVVSHLLDHGLNPQEALDAHRFHFLRGADVALEDGFPASVAERLAALGHRVRESAAALPHGGFGGGQAIAIHPETGVLWAASDRRKDGAAVGF